MNVIAIALLVVDAITPNPESVAGKTADQIERAMHNFTQGVHLGLEGRRPSVFVARSIEGIRQSMTPPRMFWIYDDKGNGHLAWRPR